MWKPLNSLLIIFKALLQLSVILLLFTATSYATNKTIKQTLTKGIVIFKIADGKIIEGWLSADIIGLLQQIGLLPSPIK